MPSIEDIVHFSDDPTPPGESPWVVPPIAERIDVVAYDPAWEDSYGTIEGQLRELLGGTALDLFHVGSTSVPGLDAKPIIDVDVIVADPSDETVWLPALELAGYVLTVREPWWHEHRMLRYQNPRANIHIFGPDAPEPWKHRVFRDHLRRNERDRDRYGEVKREAARLSNAQRETVMEYNRRKQEVIREIYATAFAAAGLLR